MKKIRKMPLSRFFDCGMLENKGFAIISSGFRLDFFKVWKLYKKKGIVLSVP